MQTSLKVIALSLLVISRPARADWIPILSGPVDRVTGNADHVVAVRGGEVWLLRDDGTTAGRLRRQEKTGAGAPRAALDKQADALLDVLGVSELDRDTDWAFDLVDDERTVGERRSARKRSAPVDPEVAGSPLLAASAHALWIHVGQSLLRVDAQGALTREGLHRGAGRALAAGEAALLFTNTQAARLLPLDGGHDRVVPLPAATISTALSARGDQIAWATPSSVGWTRKGTTPGNLAPGAVVRDLAWSGETLVVLLADSVLTIPADGAPASRLPGPRAARLVCSADPRWPWLALGPELHVSFDQGRHWQAIATPSDWQPTGAALSRHHLWLATRQGLFMSSDDTTSRRADAEPSPAEPTPGRRPRRPPRTTSWFSWLPKVSVRAAATFAPTERALEALAFAQFPLDPERVPVLAATAEEPAPPVPTAASPRRSERVIDQRDPDRDCLVRARRRAVELALAEPDRARSYLARAGHAAWLPELRVLVSRRYGRSESLDLNSSSTALSSPLGIDTVNDIRYEARATWDLAKLVFSAEELAAQTQALHMAELRRDIENTVNRLYFERRRLTLDSGGLGPVDRTVRTAELAAELDSLSGGDFGTCVGSHDGPSWSGD